VLGEAPSGVTASRLRGMFLVVFRKQKVKGKIHVVYEEPLDVASSIVSLDPSIEARALRSLRYAMRKVYPGVALMRAMLRLFMLIVFYLPVRDFHV
jgi:hypothetical protein